MPVVESSDSTLIQGVSQQHVAARQPGQVTEQINMLSDPVTGPRRRPGCQFLRFLDVPDGCTAEGMKTWPMEIGGQDVHAAFYPRKPLNIDHNPLVNGAALVIYSTSFVALGTLRNAYIDTIDPSQIDVAPLRGTLFVLNKGKVPEIISANEAEKSNPSLGGFLWIKTSAFSKRYSCQLSYTLSGTATMLEANYDTPDGTNDGDAAKADPGYIAQQLMNSLMGTGGKPFTIVRNGAYLSIRANIGGAATLQDMNVVQLCGSTYLGASGLMRVPLVSDLPPMLDSYSDGWTVAVGTNTSNLQYYRWQAAGQKWLESPAWNTGGTIANMPVRLWRHPTGMFILENLTYVARLAGDDNNSPYAAFLLEDHKITGISAYQGRLVLLAGNSVCLSDSMNPTVFTRSTVTNIVDSDYIDLAAGSMNSASFERAAQFNKDLILFARGHQAVLPGGSGALTPRTAYLVTTGTSTASLYSAPTQVGRFLMYAVPSTQVGFGFGIMAPSDYSASQYTMTPFTEHLPTYFPKLPMFIDASGASSIAVVGDGTNELRVYQYLWQANQLMQSAWHTWRFEQRVVSAHFYRDVLHLFFQFFDNGTEHVCVCDLDHKKHDYLGDSAAHVTSPYLDFAMHVQWDGVLVTDEVLKIALLFLNGSAMGCKGGAAGAGGGEPAELERFAKAGGSNPPDAVRLLDPEFETGEYWIGTAYESSITPTPPTVKDQQGRAMNEDTTRLLTYKLSLRNSGEVLLSVKDNDGTRPDYRAATIRWADSALQYMRAMVSPLSSVLCPVHAMANTSSVTFKSNSTREMNITALTYKLRLARMTRRI
jgi:hypothetical protein